MVGVSDDGRFVHQPGTVLTVAALAFATATVGIAGPSSTPALAAGAVGVLGMAIGLTKRERRVAALSAVVLLASVLAAGAFSAPPERVLPATATALLSWQFGVGAFAMADELRGGTAEHAEALHVATATGVGILATGVAYELYRVLEFGISPLGVMLLLVAVVALGVALRE